MRLFAQVAASGTLSGAARALGVPKQTVSRRLAALELALGVPLARRTTRRLRLTDVGIAYAARCAEVVRLADEAHSLASSQTSAPRGRLRLTADPTLGEAFLNELCALYLQRYPEVELEVILTARRVDLIEEDFDLAFRVGHLADSSLIGTRLGPARLVYCASPDYLQRRGRPLQPTDLLHHACVSLVPGLEVHEWPFTGRDGKRFGVRVRGPLRVNSLALARSAALAGLGIANLPFFACADDLEHKRLEALLEGWGGEAGGIYIVYPQHRFLAPRVRAFVDLATTFFRERSSSG